MQLYADRLGDALVGQNVAVERVRPPEVLLPAWRSFWLGDKVDSYIGRFVRYPKLAASRKDADVYHIVDQGQAHLLKALDPRRVVVTCHDLMLLVQASGRLGRKPESPLALEIFRSTAKLLRLAAFVVADSDQTRQDLIKFIDVDPARIPVIFPGMNQLFVSEPSLREEGRRRWGLEGHHVVLQIGTAFYKNVETTLRVIARLRQGGLPVTLLRGGGRFSSSQQEYARRVGVHDHIRELGTLPNKDLCTLYNASDVLLCPSKYEGFGWPPLEAMACGTPVVCSRAGSLGQVVGAAALTADPEDVEHLTEHVAAVFRDSSIAARLRQVGLAHVKAFDWKITARKFIDVYTQVREQA